ncbi:hypothetical protein M1N50_01135 [Dehalococcoidia bacterium]|nr:hypothetical protein [Dehalococcoidia bacterium]
MPFLRDLGAVRLRLVLTFAIYLDSWAVTTHPAIDSHACPCEGRESSQRE